MKDEDRAGFATTRWTLIGALRGDDSARRSAEEHLCRVYLPAVTGYLRSRGFGSESAAEIAQGFFADVVVGRGLLSRADPHRGRLRSLILTALNHYRIDVARKAKGASAAPLDEARVDPDSERRRADSASAEFDAQWSAAETAEALRRAEAHFLGTGKAAHWWAFEQRVLLPTVQQVEAVSLNELCERLGFRTPQLAASAVEVVRRRVVALLQEVQDEAGGGDKDASEPRASV